VSDRLGAGVRERREVLKRALAATGIEPFVADKGSALDRKTFGWLASKGLSTKMPSGSDSVDQRPGPPPGL
jgi:hypothetical protein